MKSCVLSPGNHGLSCADRLEGKVRSEGNVLSICGGEKGMKGNSCNCLLWSWCILMDKTMN